MTSYIKAKEEGDIFVKDMTGCDLDKVLSTASEMYAFSDCSDIDVIEIIHEGKRYQYDGWEPDMTFTFRDETGKAVWSRSFPRWDH